MTILPKIRIKRGDAPGTQVFIQLPDISKNEKTFLSADEAAGQTTLSAESGTNFSANKYVVIGTPGMEHTEIGLVASSTASTIVVGATSYPHPRGTKITFIPFNQVVIEDDTDSEYGSATTATVELRVDSLETFYEDIDGTAATYYRAKFKHEQGTRYSSYSDSLIGTGYTNNSVYSVKNRALESVGQKIGDFDWLTDSWLNTALWEGRRELESRQDKWSFRKKFETDIGNVQQGQNTISVPTDLRAPTTSKNLLALYIGQDRLPLERISKQQMNEHYNGVRHTTLDGAVTSSDTEITLTSSKDLDDAGSIKVAGAPVTAAITGTIDPIASTTVTGVGTKFTTEIEAGDYLTVSTETRRVVSIESTTSLTVATAFSNNANDTTPDVIHTTIDTIDYTDNLGKKTSTQDITGVTNIQHGGHADGDDVWQKASFGLPQFFTVTDDGILFSRPFDSDYHGENIYADYWGTFTALDSDTDSLDEPDYDMFVNYLSYKIKKRKSKGVISLDDDDYQQWMIRSQRLLSREMHEQTVEFVPDIERLDEE